MKTASVRDIRQNFPRVLAWVQDGEEVAITMRRKVVARLVSEKSKPKQKIAIPDFVGIQKRILGKRSPAGSLVALDREGTY